jgi:hypothetical protein
MCGDLASSEQANKRSPATDLACLIERGMDFTHGSVDPVALQRFILAYWKRLAALAHAIHEGGA